MEKIKELLNNKAFLIALGTVVTVIIGYEIAPETMDSIVTAIVDLVPGE